MKGKRILVVEDHPDHAELVTTLLQGAGYEVLHCPTGEESLGYSKRFAPHLVVMDINLPGMDGLTATQRLRRHEETAAIPVLALTAYAMPVEQELIRAAGCVDVVTKPMNTPAFLARVASLVGRAPAPGATHGPAESLAGTLTSPA